MHEHEQESRNEVQGVATKFFTEWCGEEGGHAETQWIGTQTYRSLKLSTVEVPRHRGGAHSIRSRSGSCPSFISVNRTSKTSSC